MLPTPSPFPQPGSWALFERDGVTHPVRIVAERYKAMAEARVVTVSLADMPTAASGTVEVPLAKLRDPTPLTAAEREEMERLAVELRGLKRPSQSSKARRVSKLADRDFAARVLIGHLAALPRQGLATRATREAHRFFEAAIAAGAKPEKVAA
ncbi:MAG: hypothetical protein ACK4K7_03175 [Allosphingosinicella sp.]|uniref:hypothetical protein n=1 Tax=Allosphingosinicella sp. TaxID=2823234 RepID=UPI00392C5424